MKLIEFSKIADLLAREHKIKIKEERRWACNIKTRDVFYRKEDIYTLPEDQILGLLLHEIAHIHYTTDTKPQKKDPELTHTVINVLEDISIENIIGGDYPNAKEILDYTKKEVLDVLIKELPKLNMISEHERALLYASMKFEGRGYEKVKEKYEKTGEKIEKLMTKEKDIIYNRKKTSDLLPLAKQIIKILNQELGELTEIQKRLMENNDPGGETEVQYDPRKNIKQQIIEKLKTGRSYGFELDSNDEIAYIDTIGDMAKIMGKRLRSVLKRNNTMEFGGRYRTGKLVAKRFVRIKTIKDRKPFARRIIKSNQSYAFLITSDVSGSMLCGQGVKNYPASHALSSLYMVGEALRIAKTSRTLMIFADDAIKIAPPGKKEIKWEEIKDRKKREDTGGGTSIHTAILAGVKILEKEQAERKILILLTDGESSMEEMKKAYKKAIDNNIEPIAIEITTRKNTELQKVFPPEKRIIIDGVKNTHKIGDAFIKILESTIKLSQ